MKKFVSLLLAASIVMSLPVFAFAHCGGGRGYANSRYQGSYSGGGYYQCYYDGCYETDYHTHGYYGGGGHCW